MFMDNNIINQEDNVSGRDYREIFFSWYFPEFEKYERGRTWYIIIGVVTSALVLYNIFTYNFLFIVIIILVAFILILYHLKDVENIQFKIVDTGIVVHETFTPWKEIETFYIIYNPPEVKNLYFTFRKFSRPMLIVPIQKENPVKIRHFIRKFVPEDIEKEEEPLSHTLGREMKL